MGQLIDEARWNNISARLNSKTPFGDHKYIETAEAYDYCENKTFYSWFCTNTGKWLPSITATLDLVRSYLVQQSSILRFNNPTITLKVMVKTLAFITSWSEEIKYFIDDKLLQETASDVLMMEDMEFISIISIEDRSHWYSDDIEHLERIEGESWKSYRIRRRDLKNSLRNASRQQVERELVINSSTDYKNRNKGLIPSVPVLADETNLSEFKVKERGDKDIHHQGKRDFTKQSIEIYLIDNPSATQTQIAKELNISLRTVKGAKN